MPPRILVLCVLSTVAARSHADDPPPSQQYLHFIRAQAAALRAKDTVPTTKDAWTTQRIALREQLLRAWGRFPAEPCPLAPTKLGELKREGYTVEKIIFQTFPGVWMTANAYVPHKSGKLPAILAVHGHWRGAKQDPVVQARCIGAAKLGFFVLAVDAFGAGERGIGKALGEYHGEMTAATLLPTGLTLCGLQVYENMRAVDYLRTRPEVDGDWIGITGASGGGNQTMYAGGWDDRFKAAAPVCSVGNYQAYLGIACCMCELVPGALQFTEEWGVLGMTAPRGLMVVNATRDAVQFSVPEAKKSLARVEPVYKLYGEGKEKNVRHAIFESGHDYNKAMREAVYGWMTLHLKGQGDGSPIPEPEIKTEDPETLRCFPGNSRPDDWVTIPKFAALRGKELQAKWVGNFNARLGGTDVDWLRNLLIQGVSQDTVASPRLESLADGTTRLLHFQPESGLHLTARIESGKAKDAPLTILLNLDGAEKAVSSSLAAEIRKAGWMLVTLDLRATGKLVPANDRIGRAPDHNSAQWGLWIGRPLLEQWVVDVSKLLACLEKVDGKLPKDVIVIGEGPAGLVAYTSAMGFKRITKVAAIKSLSSYLTDEPYQAQHLGIIVPGILRDFGDVWALASLAAGRRLVIAGGVSGNGKPLTREQVQSIYRPAFLNWVMLNKAEELKFVDPANPAEIVRALQ